jgi:nucleotide-binding universal stress UspA family protein
MTRVIAAIDNSVAAQPVLSTALAMAELLEAAVEPVHVRVDGDRTVRAVAERADLSVSELAGSVPEQLVAAGAAEDVVLVVVGARGTPLRSRPVGQTAITVATSLPKPVLVVPPDARRAGTIRRVLVPLEGTIATSLAPQGVIAVAARAQLDVIVLHVIDELSIPLFADQPQHETEAWAREFLERYCPCGVGSIRLETRVGRPKDVIAPAADEIGADLIALAWAGSLAQDRAPVVRAVLERGRAPVLLVPVIVGRPEAAGTRQKEALWNSLQSSHA